MQNPIESIEDLFFSQDWFCKRLSDTEIMAELSGRWCDYNVHFVWNEDTNVLQFYILLLDIQIPEGKYTEICELICLINEKLSLGHFEIFSPIKTAAFRHAFLLPGTRTISEALVEQMIELALDTCERFYSTFQFVIFGDKSPKEAAGMTMIDTAGEA